MNKPNKHREKTKLLSYPLLPLEAHTADWWRELGRKEGYERGWKDAKKGNATVGETIIYAYRIRKQEHIATLKEIKKRCKERYTGAFGIGFDIYNFEKWLEKEIKEAKGK